MSARRSNVVTARSLRAEARSRVSAFLASRGRLQGSNPRSSPVRGGVKLEIPGGDDDDNGSFEEVKPIAPSFEQRDSRTDFKHIPATVVFEDDDTRNNKRWKSDSVLCRADGDMITEYQGGGVMVLRRSGLDIEVQPALPSPSLSRMKSYRPPYVQSERRNILLYVVVALIIAFLGFVGALFLQSWGERVSVLEAERDQRKPWVDHQCRDPAHFMMAPPQVQVLCNEISAKVDNCCMRRGFTDTASSYCGYVFEAGSNVLSAGAGAIYWIIVVLITALLLLGIFAYCTKRSTDGGISELIRWFTLQQISRASAAADSQRA